MGCFSELVCRKSPPQKTRYECRNLTMPGSLRWPKVLARLTQTPVNQPKRYRSSATMYRNREPGDRATIAAGIEAGAHGNRTCLHSLLMSPQQDFGSVRVGPPSAKAVSPPHQRMKQISSAPFPMPAPAQHSIRVYREAEDGDQMQPGSQNYSHWAE